MNHQIMKTRTRIQVFARKRLAGVKHSEKYGLRIFGDYDDKDNQDLFLWKIRINYDWENKSFLKNDSLYIY